ncbi:MAG: hypothetical protein ACON4N_14230 [Myxococcota bacterium]
MSSLQHLFSRRHAAVVLALGTMGCWKVDATSVDFKSQPFEPEIGAPDGWSVEQFTMDLRCPDGTEARLYVVYPDELDRRVTPDAPSPPVAIVFHSGAFDYVVNPTSADPLANTSYQESVDGILRLSAPWGFERVTAALGLFPNFEPFETHTAALPAALAERGIASIWPVNCWGDLWHNRQGQADNDYSGDRFFRDGRTAAEFTWAHATSNFPPGNPLELPVQVTADDLFLVGLGEGSRAVSELLSVIGEDGFTYRPAAVVLDSPADDLRPYYDVNTEAFNLIEAGLNRLFPEGRISVMTGSMSRVPYGNIPPRVGLVWSSNDTRIPANANNALLDRFTTYTGVDIWVYDDVAPRHVLSNGDPEIAADVAGFLVSGTAGLTTAP